MDISLTEAGRNEAEAAAKEIAALRKEMFTCLNEEEKTILLSLLEKLNGEWDIRYREKVLARTETKDTQCKDHRCS